MHIEVKSKILVLILVLFCSGMLPAFSVSPGNIKNGERTIFFDEKWGSSGEIRQELRLRDLTVYT